MLKAFSLLTIALSLLSTSCSQFNSSSNSSHTNASPQHSDTPYYDPLCFTDVDLLADYTPAGHDSLWAKIRNGYQLQDYYNPRMDTYIAYYGRHQKYLDLSLIHI